MKKEDLKELVLRSLTDEINEADRMLIENQAIPDYRFSSGFRDKVLGLISEGATLSIRKQDIFSGLDSVFTRIALTGLAAILILAVSLFLTQGSLSYDTLIGMDSNVDEGLISLLIK